MIHGDRREKNTLFSYFGKEFKKLYGQNERATQAGAMHVCISDTSML